MRLSWAPALLSLLFTAQQALAQSDAEVDLAYQHSATGLGAFNAGQFDRALDEFGQAYSIVHLPSLALHMARAHVRLGHLVMAAQFYEQAKRLPDGLGDPEVQQSARQAAEIELQQVKNRIPHLTVEAPGVAAGALVIQIDAVFVPAARAAQGWELDPGPHEVVAQFGNQVRQQRVALAESESKKIVLTFDVVPAPNEQRPTPAQASGSSVHSNLRTAGWVSLGIGGAAFAFAGTTAIWALVKHHELANEPHWDVNHCELASVSAVSDCQNYNKLRNLLTVGFYTGVVGAVAGATLLLLAPKDNADPKAGVGHLSAAVGFGFVGIQGSVH